MSLISTAVASMPHGSVPLVDDLADHGVEALALRQQLIELGLADHTAECGLCELAGREQVVLDLDERFDRVGDPKIHDRVDLDRHVVPGDHILWRDVHGHDAQRNSDHSLDAEGQQEDQTGSLRTGQPAQPEDDAAFIFA